MGNKKFFCFSPSVVPFVTGICLVSISSAIDSLGTLFQF